MNLRKVGFRGVTPAGLVLILAPTAIALVVVLASSADAQGDAPPPADPPWSMGSAESMGMTEMMEMMGPEAIATMSGNWSDMMGSAESMGMTEMMEMMGPETMPTMSGNWSDMMSSGHMAEE